MARKPWLFVTDPWRTLDHPRDTSLRLIEAAAALRQPVAWTSVRSIRWQTGALRADCSMIRDREGASILRKSSPAEPSTQPMLIEDFDQIHYRVDPPVDLAYLHPLQMLAQVARRKLVNPPEAISLLSEKLLGNSLPALAPRSLVSSDAQALREFINTQGVAVLKPLHTAQSQGVLKLTAQDDAQRISAALNHATENFTRPCLLQEFLPGVQSKGETRLWFLDGRLLACVQKIPAAGQFKIDMDQGSTLAPARLEPSESKPVASISALLRRHRIRLAAVDWIDGKITDFNITSPGLIVGMEEVIGKPLAPAIIRRLQKPFST